MADTVGNRLGERGTFRYITDGGVEYNIQLDNSVSLAVGNERSTAALLPILKASQSRPIQPRYYRLQLVSDPRVTKSVVCCDPTDLNWINNFAAQLTINSVPYVITSRIGERRSVLKVDEALP